MGLNVNQVIKSVAIYIVQVGALWGLLEGYTYFKDDALKDFLGSYWILIYILPIFTTVYFAFRESHVEETVHENITTRGDFSPGKVGQNYSIGIHQENAMELDASKSPSLAPQQTPKLKEMVFTEGHYSPGKVGGDYTVQDKSETSDNLIASGESAEPTETNNIITNIITKSEKNIRTRGNYSPGEVGGDYKIEQ